MKKLKFVKPISQILMKKAETIPVEKIQSKSVQDLIEAMLKIAYGEQKDRKKPVLVGLAAPQVGISKRIILVDVGANGLGDVSDLRVFINPRIVKFSKRKKRWYEGCFSTDRVCGIVARPSIITIQAYTQEGKEVTTKYKGYVARIFQHEIDHLNGIEFVKHVKSKNDLHWVEEDEFPKYRNKQGWRKWPHKCSKETWYKIKGIKR